MLRLLGIIITASLLVGCQSTHKKSNNRVNLTNAAKYNVRLGLGYLEQGKPDRAKHKLQMALKQNPRSAEANGAMAYLFEKTGQPKRAKTYYERAIDYADDRSAARNNYGTFLCRQKQYKEAEANFLSAANDEDYLHTDLAFENAGLCALQQGQVAKARRFFKKAIERNPQRRSAIYQLARLDYRNKQYKTAKKTLDSYVKHAQASPEALYLAMQISRKLHKFREAMSYEMMLKSSYPNYWARRQARRQVG